jgi:hypothetical protein
VLLGDIAPHGHAAAVEVGEAAGGRVGANCLVVRDRVDAGQLLGRTVQFEHAEADAGGRLDLRLLAQSLDDLAAKTLTAVGGAGEDVVGGDGLIEDLADGRLDRGRKDRYQADQGESDHQRGGGRGGAAWAAHRVLAGELAGLAGPMGERPAEQPGERPGDQWAQHPHA